MAVVAAFDALGIERARAVAAKIVQQMREKLPRGDGRWLEFVERAEDSLALAGTLPDPDRMVALASAVKDAVSAVAMASRAIPRRPTAGRPTGAELMAYMVPGRHLPIASLTDPRQALWVEVHKMLAQEPQLKATVGIGRYLPGPSHGFALRAAEAGII